MLQNELDPRSRTILMETVRDYVETAEPVGSRTLSKKLPEKLSSATIRNVMADLEDMGYLQQPHTSAGRVPTDRGYRYFVNQLLKSKTKSPASLTRFTGDLKQESLEGVLESACTFLSTNTHQAGLVMLPSFWNLSLKQIQFVLVGPNKVLAVFVSQMGVLQNKILDVDEPFTQDKLNSISNYLNQEFAGRSLHAIRKDLIHRNRNEKERYRQLMKKASELWAKMFPDSGTTGLIVDGLINLLDQPEFSADVDKMKALMKTLEEKEKLIQLLDLCLHEDGLTILIGQEDLKRELEGYSLIAHNYRLDEEKVGTLAIFGPKRMDYEKVIGIVNATATNVSDFLSKKIHEGN